MHYRGREEQLLAITAITPAWTSEIEESHHKDPYYEQLIKEILMHPENTGGYSYNQGVVRYKGRVCVGSAEDLRNKLINLFHGSSLGGHSGVVHSYHRMKGHFF